PSLNQTRWDLNSDYSDRLLGGGISGSLFERMEAWSWACNEPASGKCRRPASGLQACSHCRNTPVPLREYLRGKFKLRHYQPNQYKPQLSQRDRAAAQFNTRRTVLT